MSTESLIQTARAAIGDSEALKAIVRANSTNTEFTEALTADDALFEAVKALSEKKVVSTPEEVPEPEVEAVPPPSPEEVAKVKAMNDAPDQSSGIESLVISMNKKSTPTREVKDGVFSFASTVKKSDITARGLALNLPTTGESMEEYKDYLTQITKAAFYNENNCWKVVGKTDAHWALVSITSTARVHYNIMKPIHEALGHKVPEHK